MDVEVENAVRAMNAAVGHELPVHESINIKELKAWLMTAPVIIDSRGVPWNHTVLSCLCKIKVIDSSLIHTTVDDSNFWGSLAHVYEINLDLSDRALDGREDAIKDWITQACSRLYLKKFSVIFEIPLPGHPSGTPISPAAWNLLKFCNGLFTQIGQVEAKKAHWLRVPCRAYIWEAYHNRRLTRPLEFYPEPDDTMGISNEEKDGKANGERFDVGGKQSGEGKKPEQDKNNDAELEFHDGEADPDDKEMTFPDFVKHLGFVEKDLESDEGDDEDMTFADFIKHLGYSEKDLESDEEDLKDDKLGGREGSRGKAKRKNSEDHAFAVLKHRGGYVKMSKNYARRRISRDHIRTTK